MASGKKIAEKILDPRAPSTFLSFIRDKLLMTKRDKRDRSEFLLNNRMTDTQSARTQPAPTVPGGIHHKIYDNYYADRDVRRSVAPPMVLLAEGEKPLALASTTDETKSLTQQKLLSTVVPETEFSVTRPLPVPTPGLGTAWKRSRESELPSMLRVPN